MNIKCFFGFHDWVVTKTIETRIPDYASDCGGYIDIQDLVCLRCHKTELNATKQTEKIKQARIDLIRRQKQAEEIMTEFLEKE